MIRRTLPALPDKARAEITTEKIRGGGLSAPTPHRRKIVLGDGTGCDGCGQIIKPTERLHSVRIGDVLTLRLHDVCYIAWTTYRA